MASGHGSGMRFDRGDGKSPPPEDELLSLPEAKLTGDDWEGMADTIGGRAALYNVRTETEHPLNWNPEANDR